MTLAEGGFGGFFAPELKYAGYDHIIVSGRSDKPVYIWIDDDKIEIHDAKHIWGKTTWETDEIVKEEIGDADIQISYIGPAAENLVYTCPVFCNLYHSGGRLGCGTIMGSKRLKAIAIRGSQGVQLAYPNDFEKLTVNKDKILSRPKARLLAFAYTKLGIKPPENNAPRGVYFCRLYENTNQFLSMKNKEMGRTLFDNNLVVLSELWKERYAKRRRL